MKVNRMRFGKLAALALILLLAVGGYAFAAANTVPDSYAGDGSAVISGYTVSNIHYNLNAANPKNIDSVDFDVDVAPVAGSTIKIRLAPAGTWYTCTATGTAVSCTTAAATVLAATELTVVIAQ